jgi:hypothetical protein
MQKLISASLVLLLALVMTGCSMFAKQQDMREVFTLLPIATGPENFVYKQHIALKKQLQQHDFIAVTKLDSKALTVVVLLPNGQKVFSASYDGLHFSQSVQGTPDISVQEIVSIMQFALWPRQALEIAYPSSQKWLIIDTTKQRLLMRESKVLLEVNKSDEGTTINNLQSDYQVNIRHLN